MAHWYYKGRTTSPIKHPELGPVVLKPRSRFEAPRSAVQHLVNAGLCVRLSDPKPKVQSSAEVEEKHEATVEVVANPDPKRELKYPVVEEENTKKEPEENESYQGLVEYTASVDDGSVESDVSSEDKVSRRGRRGRKKRNSNQEGS